MSETAGTAPISVATEIEQELAALRTLQRTPGSRTVRLLSEALTLLRDQALRLERVEGALRKVLNHQVSGGMSTLDSAQQWGLDVILIANEALTPSADTGSQT